MRKLLSIATIALVSVLALSACNKTDEDNAKRAAAAAAVEAPVVLPTDANDTAAWKAYLVGVVKQNMEGVKTGRPYMYFVPAGNEADVEEKRAFQLDNVKTTVSRGVLPGNMMAFGGPDSKITADLIIDAFKGAQAGQFKDVMVLFVGAQADNERVKEALVPTSATYRFVEMK